MDWDTPSIRPLISVRNSIKSTVEKREILKKKKIRQTMPSIMLQVLHCFHEIFAKKV